MTTRKPEHLSWEKAAAIPENLLTAWQTLMLIAEMKEGQSVLVHAGASGVGLAAIQLAKMFGACVTGLALVLLTRSTYAKLMLTAKP